MHIEIAYSIAGVPIRLTAERWFHKAIHAPMLIALLIVCVACQSVSTPAMSPSPSKTALPPGAIILRNGTVIDGTGATPIPDGLLALKDGKIIKQVCHPATMFTSRPGTYTTLRMVLPAV